MGHSYYAVQRGKHDVNNCIFLSWDDAKPHVEGYAEAAYKKFDRLDDAATYTRTSMSSCERDERDAGDGDGDGDDDSCSASASASISKAAITPSQTNRQDDDDDNDENDTGSNNNGDGHDDDDDVSDPFPLSTLKHSSGSTAARSNNATGEQRNSSSSNSIGSDDTNTPKKSSSSTANSNTTTAQTEDKNADPSAPKNSTEVQPLPPPPSAPPNRKRKQCSISATVTTQTATETTEPTETEAQQPQQAYPGTSNNPTDDTTNRETFEIDGHIMRKRKPSRAWLTMHERLRTYRDRTGSFRVGLGDKHDAVLRRWISEQQHQYKCYRQGRRHFTSGQKIQMLSDIGFEFTYHSWDTRIGQLRRFRAIHGSCDVPLDDPLLGKWMEVQKKQLGLLGKGKECKLTQVQVDQLAQLGVDELKPEEVKHSHRPETEEKVRKWEEMFGKLKEFKETFNHCNVPKSEAKYSGLYKWNCGQRLEYKKLKDGHNCRMTARKLQQLNDIGFSFNPRSRYHKWDERMDQLRQFKDEHGHLRVPVTNPNLGEFVARQRMEYAKFTEGDTSVCMDKERAQELIDLGFVFQAGKRRAPDQKKPRMTWDERFEELNRFKDLNGHTLVPQSSMGLGEWVHKQRKNYKKLKAGDHSPLSTERVLKLADVGFVFDASGYRRGKKMMYSLPSSDSTPIVMPVSTPTPCRPTMI